MDTKPYSFAVSVMGEETMRILKASFLILSVLQGVRSQTPASSAGDSSVPVRNFQLSISTEKTSYLVGESIILQIALRNVGDTRRGVSVLKHPIPFDIDVLLPGEDWIPWAARPRAPLTEEGRKLKLKEAFGMHGIILSPQQESVSEYELNDLYHMEIPGTYRVRALHKFLGAPPRDLMWSNEITVTVLPNPEKSK